MTATYDAIVVGGGHNGLVAAAYLARSGARTVVLEGRHKTGGAATTEAPWPDAPEYQVTRLSYVMSLLPPTIISELDLARHGYKIYPMGPYYQAFPEGGSIKLYADDAKRNHEEVSKWSKKDADAMPRWDAWLEGLADILGPLLLTVPPAIGSRRPRDLAGTLKLAWRNRGLDVRTVADVTRLMTMSIADLLDDWFESPQVKGALAVNGVIGTWAGPYSPGTAYVMAHHSIGDVGDGHLGNWGFQEGGMGGVSAAIEAAARAHGAQIRTGARVARVLVEGDRAVGVVLENGEEIRAQVVVSTLHPRTAFLEQVGAEYLPDDFVSRHRALEVPQRRREDQPGPGRAARLHRRSRLAAAGAPHRLGRDGADHGVHRARFPDAREGRPAQLPFSDGVIPTTFDTKLCPEGSHIMSLFTQWVPEDWNAEPHTAELEAYADRMIDCYNELAPNFKASILHRDIVGPYADGARVRPGRRQHLPRRAVPGAAVPHAAGPRLRRLPDPAARPVLRQLGHPRRRRRLRHPRLAGRQGRHRGQEDRAPVPAAAQAIQAGMTAKTDPERMTGARPAGRAGLAAMLEARSVAVVGASQRPGTFGERMLAEVAASRSGPRIYPVNPRYPQIGGRQCYPSLADLPGPVDLVLLGVPDAALEAQLTLAARRGDRSAVIFGNAHEDPGAPGPAGQPLTDPDPASSHPASSGPASSGPAAPIPPAPIPPAPARQLRSRRRRFGRAGAARAAGRRSRQRPGWSCAAPAAWASPT